LALQYLRSVRSTASESGYQTVEICCKALEHDHKSWVKTVRHLLKFLHTMGAIGLMGAMASLLVLVSMTPPPTSLATYASIRGIMGVIATWILFPSLGVMLIAGLLAMAFSRVYQNAGWAWMKAATGILMFEGCLVGVVGPIQQEAEQSAKALIGEIDPTTLAQSLGGERNVLWMLLAVSTANVIVGIWRPRFVKTRT
jgi:hypothetical protein